MPMNQPIMPQQPVKYQGSYLEMLKQLLMQNPQLMQELMMKQGASPGGNMSPNGTVRQMVGPDTNDLMGRDPELMQNYREKLQGRRVNL